MHRTFRVVRGRRLETVGASVGLVTIAIGFVLGWKVTTALAWGVAGAALVAGAPSAVFLGASVAALLLTPMVISFWSASRGEFMARAAFYLLSVGLVLEYRNGFTQRRGRHFRRGGTGREPAP